MGYLKTGGRGGGAGEPPEPPLDPHVRTVKIQMSLCIRAILSVLKFRLGKRLTIDYLRGLNGRTCQLEVP